VAIAQLTLFEILFGESEDSPEIDPGGPVNLGRFYFHGSKAPHRIENGAGNLRQLPWTAYDGKKVLAPIWVSPDPKFAKLYASARGWVYKVKLNGLQKTFPLEDVMVMDGNYYVPSPYGESIIQDMLDRSMFNLKSDDYYEAEEILKSVALLHYDTLETKDFIDWLKDNGYDSFKVRGDGPTNIAVLDTSNVEIVDSMQTSEV
jgi:hypothetical protein